MINTRPDNEDAAQPGSAAEERAAQAASLAYHHLSVTGSSIAMDDIRASQAALAASPGPALAHRKSGMRSLKLYIIDKVLDRLLRAVDVRSVGEAFGFELCGAEAWLTQHGGARS